MYVYILTSHSICSHFLHNAIQMITQFNDNEIVNRNEEQNLLDDALYVYREETWRMSFADAFFLHYAVGCLDILIDTQSPLAAGVDTTDNSDEHFNSAADQDLGDEIN